MMAEELAKIDTEVKVTEPKAPTGGRLSFSDIMGVRQPFVEKRGQIREEIKSTEGEILAGQQAQKEMAAEGKMAVEQRTAEQVRGAQQKFQERMQAEPLPAFVPSQDNFRDIAGLFSLIGVVGMIAGKSSGLGAMNAMNGMLEGYRSGRNDLYRRERDVFDKNFKTMLQRHAEFRKDMDDAINLAKTDRQAGLQAADLAAVKAGSEVVKAQIRRGDLLGAYETVKEGEAAATKALEMVNSSLNAERQAQIQANAMRERFSQQMQLQDIRLGAQQSMLDQRLAAAQAAADAKTAGATQKIPKEITAQNTLRNNLIPKIEEAMPVLDRLNRENKWNTLTALLAFDTRAAEVAFKDDKEALNLILTLAYFRSKEFETAGKALTRKEDQILAPIVRGDLRAYEGIKNALEVGLKTLKQEQKGLEAVYPALKTYNDVIRGELGMGGETPATPGTAGVDVAGERQRANDAIARGANREAVAARFKQKTGEEL
jgi:hypothetical protein